MDLLRTIVKAKLTPKNRLNVEYLEHHPDTDGQAVEPDVVTREGKHEAHPDLVQEFANLRMHLATLCEQGEFTEFEEDSSKLEKFLATQVSFSGEDDHRGVTLVGERSLKHNKVLNLVAPFTKLDSAHSDYSYAESLGLVLDNLIREIDQYVAGTKYAPTKQLNLFEGPGSEEHEDDASETLDPRLVEKKGKRKKKGKQVQLNQTVQEEQLANAQ